MDSAGTRLLRCLKNRGSYLEHRRYQVRPRRAGWRRGSGQQDLLGQQQSHSFVSATTNAGQIRSSQLEAFHLYFWSPSIPRLMSHQSIIPLIRRLEVQSLFLVFILLILLLSQLSRRKLHRKIEKELLKALVLPRDIDSITCRFPSEPVTCYFTTELVSGSHASYAI